MPILLVGDFNSKADGTGTATYGDLLASGFADAWTVTSPKKPSHTCCQDADPLNAESLLSRRIDLLLYRGAPIRPVATTVLGDETDDKTPSGLWPADHAGVLGILQLIAEPALPP